MDAARRSTLVRWVIVLVVLAGTVSSAVLAARAGARRADRNRLAAWEAQAGPILARAGALREDLDRAVNRVMRSREADLVSLRAGWERARRDLIAVRTPALLLAVTSDYVNAVQRSIDAVSWLDELARANAPADRRRLSRRLNAVLAAAGDLWARGDGGLGRLRAGLGEATAPGSGTRTSDPCPEPDPRGCI